MKSDMRVMGYRSKAERLSEARLIAKSTGMDVRQRNAFLKAIGRVADDLQNCADVRQSILDRVRSVSRLDRDACRRRSEKAAKK